MAGKGQISKPTPVVPLVTGAPTIPGAIDGGYRVSDFTETLKDQAFSALYNIAGATLMAYRGIAWGLFSTDTGVPIFPKCLYFEVSLQEQGQITDAPVEDGSFVSYNKVDAPAQYVLGMSLGPVSAQQSTDLALLRQMRSSTDLYYVHMPNFISPAVNVVGLSIRRTTQSGADLLLVSVMLREVRTFATATLTTKKNGYSATATQVGVVSAQTPTAAQAKAIAS